MSGIALCLKRKQSWSRTDVAASVQPVSAENEHISAEHKAAGLVFLSLDRFPLKETL